MPLPTSLKVAHIDEDGRRFALVINSRCATVSISLDRATLKRVFKDIGEVLSNTATRKTFHRDPIERWDIGRKLHPQNLTTHERTPDHD